MLLRGSSWNFKTYKFSLDSSNEKLQQFNFFFVDKIFKKTHMMIATIPLRIVICNWIQILIKRIADKNYTLIRFNCQVASQVAIISFMHILIWFDRFRERNLNEAESTILELGMGDREYTQATSHTKSFVLWLVTETLFLMVRVTWGS